MTWRCRIVCGVALLLLASGNRGAADSAGDAGTSSLWRSFTSGVDRALVSRCLTPAAGTAMSELVAAGTLKPILGDAFTLKRGHVGGDAIQIELEDPLQRLYVLTLSPAGARTEEPAGRGARFWFYPAPTNPPDPRAQEVLLALAARFDAAIPDAAFAPCAGTNQPGEDPRYPRRLALASAVVETLIIIAAVLFSLRTIRRLDQENIHR